MEATLERLTAYPPPPRDFRPQPKSKGALPPMHHSAPPEATAFVDLPDDESDEDEAPPVKPKKRSHAEMEGGHRVFHSKQQFRAQHQKQSPLHSRHTAGGDHRPPNPPRPAHPSAAGHRAPPPHPIQVTPLQTRSPSPERVAILLPPPPTQQVPPSPAVHVPPDAPLPPVTPATHMETPRQEHDLALGLRKERHAFYLKATTAARGTVKMDIPKPPLRPPIQPPGLFHLMACGLLAFDLEHGKYEDFEAQVHEWKNHPTFMDRLFVAYGRFYSPSHQVTTTYFLCPLCRL